MLFTEIFRVAVDALRVNKLRSLLTMLGIVIGVGAVIAMVALGNGAQSSVNERLNKLGTTLLQVNAQRVYQTGAATSNMAKLTMKDVDMIQQRSTHVAALNPQQDKNLSVVWKRQNANADIVGTLPNFQEGRKF